MAAVILPLLPEGPFGPSGGIRPRALWALVLFFSGLSFVGYLARRAVGRGRGYALAGTLGGIVSSTSVTLTFSRLSREQPVAGACAGRGRHRAPTRAVPARARRDRRARAARSARALWPVVRRARRSSASALVVYGLGDRTTQRPGRDKDKNPLQIRAALQMAAAVSVRAVWRVVRHGEIRQRRACSASAAVLGLTDVDALTLSMARLTTTGTRPTSRPRARDRHPREHPGQAGHCALHARTRTRTAARRGRARADGAARSAPRSCCADRTGLVQIARGTLSPRA